MSKYDFNRDNVMKKIILYTTDNYSEDFIEQYEIVDNDNNIQTIIDSLIIDECSDIRVFELGNEITEKFDTES